MKNLLFCSLLFSLFFDLQSQTPERYHAAQIRKKLEKLKVLGSVLYVAAHPDDENTRMITYFANEKLMRTAYLSATRGDGGQNLLGPEIREELGVIRTHELLGARKKDGGRQFFARANDFGYSKHPDETFNIWDREEVLADFVWVFRKFRPDVVITRFNKTPGTTHGHHTASAILAHEAFRLSGDSEAFPEQLEYVQPWKPKRIYWNTGWWWFRNGYDTTHLSQVNVGNYDPLIGKSYTEIAAESRSMHKSQGFGSSGARGDEIEYLEQWDGDDADDPFQNLVTDWSSVSGSEQTLFFINKAISEYDQTNPANILGSLMAARKQLQNLDDPFWKEVKTKEIDELVKAITGLYLELVASDSYYTPGQTIEIKFEAINRSTQEMRLLNLKMNTEVNPIELNTKLIANRAFRTSITCDIPKDFSYSSPYWLNDRASLGMYYVADQEQRGKPENDPPIAGVAEIQVGGEEVVAFTVPVVFKRTDPVKGEVYKPLAIGPPVMVNLDRKIRVFGDETSKSVTATVICGVDSAKGSVKVNVPAGWRVSPKSYEYRLTAKDEEKTFEFEVTPPKKASQEKVTASVSYEGNPYQLGRKIIRYDHIPEQVLFPPAAMKVVRIPLARKGDKIGYLMGAGDLIPQNLAGIGYRVDLLEKEDIISENLRQYDAVILGVRAFNTVDWLEYKNEELFDYVKQGGNLIVQYNTNRRLKTDRVAPYHLKISRDRVAVEEAPVRILDEKHPLITGPNKITSDDFEGWVQERGLYFPSEWADEFTPILSSNDPGEPAREGGLLVAKYGEGNYIYTGYSWFRELPAGVPGAYRLFVNMISLGK